MKERLEEIKSVYEDYKELQKKGDFKQADIALLYLSENHIDWLIEQAELVSYFAWKNGELNEFLNKYIEPKHLGKNVIDVAMDIIVKQSEHVHEQEQQNKRYKQALEFYAEPENYCVRFEDDYEPILQDNGKTARQVLGWEEEK